jgi:hypothetical protein
MIPLTATAPVRDLMKTILWFSEPVYLSHKSSIHMGYNRAVLTDGETGECSSINLSTGEVSTVGEALDRVPGPSFDWLEFGVLESDASSGSSLVYSSLEGTIERQALIPPSLRVSTLLASPLGEAASLAVDVVENRWYAYYFGSGAFGTGSAVLASASANIDVYESDAPTADPTAALDADHFAVEALTDNSAQARNVEALTGAYFGNLAVSTTKVFAGGEQSYAALSKRSFTSSATEFPYPTDGTFAVVTDLADNQLYALGDDQDNFLDGPSGYVARLVPLADGTLLRHAALASVVLSTPFYLSHQSSVHSGRRRVAFIDRDTGAAYEVDLRTGNVTELGEQLHRGAATPHWLHTGVYEHPEEDLNNLLYASLEGNVERQAVGTSLNTTTVYNATLGEVASITVDATEGKWYFFYQGEGPHLGGGAVVGSAAASLSFGAESEETFRVVTLQVSDAVELDISEEVGRVFGTIGVSGSRIFVTGSDDAIAIDKGSREIQYQSLAYADAALVTDLSTNKLYALGDADGEILEGELGDVASLVPLSADTAARSATARVVYLTSPVYIGVRSLVLSGYHHAVLVDHESGESYTVSFVTGAVKALPDLLPRTLETSYWITAGAADRPSVGSYGTIYAALDGTVERQALHVASATDTVLERRMGSAASIAVDALQSKWYFLFSGVGENMSGLVVFGSASATVQIGGSSETPTANPSAVPTSDPTAAPTRAPVPVAAVFKVVQLTTNRAKTLDVWSVAGLYRGMMALS